jgi:putative nucleotidyltransferase with HDIG domain
VSDLVSKSTISGTIRRILPSFSLSVKLTLYFVLFGVLIGYISFVLYTIGAAKHNIELAYKTLVPMFQEITGSRGEDFIANLAGRQNYELVRIYNIILKTTQATYGKIVPGVFFYDRIEASWKEVHIEAGNIIRNVPARQADIPALNECVVKNMYHSSQVFFGKSDRVSFMMHLPLEGAKNIYVLSLSLDREGIAGFIRHNVERIFIFSVLIFAVSIILGKFFAIRVTAPIRVLSEVARERASGNYKQEFTLERSDEIGVLADSLNVMTKKIDSHVREIERRIKTMETMNQIDKAVLSSISRADLLERVIGLVSSLFRSSSTSMALYNQEKRGFDLLTRFQGIYPGILADNSFIPVGHIDPDSMDRMKQVFQFIPSEANPDFRRLFELLVGGGFRSGINVPVCQSDEYLGSLVLSRDDAKGFSPKEVVSITMLADQVGVALQSIRAVEEKEELLVGILIALTRSIDAKSKWTAGHSERVATYSEKLAVSLRMGEDDIRTVALSALLHDIGKIAVSELILDKPARLTSDEYAIIKEHPSTGARIIADIPSYKKIVPGVLYHHEHWDGSGYPEGLSGESIPMNSRIIAIADVFDAISAERPYRKGLNRSDSLSFMKEHAGILFDASLLDVFVGIISAER